MVSFPYHSHIFRDSYGSGMGIVWEAYHKAVPLLGVPENPIDTIFKANSPFCCLVVFSFWTPCPVFASTSTAIKPEV